MQNCVYAKKTEITAIYTRNNLSWDGANVAEDGSVKLDLQEGTTTITLKNNVDGNIGYNIFIYDASKEVELAVKDLLEIKPEEYPYSLKNADVKYAYRGVLKGGKKKNITIEAKSATSIKLLLAIEDNNSYPKEKKPTIANLKFSAEVLLDGQYPRGKDYSFSLKNEQGEIIETIHNKDGYISFSNIALKDKGTYIYYISQNEGKDKKTTYDSADYKIVVVAEGKNAVKVTYEKDGVVKETLPRFSNYKESKPLNTEDVAEYPSNAKKATSQTNYLLISALAIAVLMVVFYIVIGRKKG
jgi:hypothetical protein